MMNKGLELIEAFHLFPATLEQLDVLVHPQSVIHSMVEYRDGSVSGAARYTGHAHTDFLCSGLAGRIATPSPRLRLEEIGELTFERSTTTGFQPFAVP